MGWNPKQTASAVASIMLLVAAGCAETPTSVTGNELATPRLWVTSPEVDIRGKLTLSKGSRPGTCAVKIDFTGLDEGFYRVLKKSPNNPNDPPLGTYVFQIPKQLGYVGPTFEAPSSNYSYSVSLWGYGEKSGSYGSYADPLQYIKGSVPLNDISMLYLGSAPNPLGGGPFDWATTSQVLVPIYRNANFKLQNGCGVKLL